jgi:2-hydroxychromene-2-carboxylate isomerase
MRRIRLLISAYYADIIYASAEISVIFYATYAENNDYDLRIGREMVEYVHERADWMEFRWSGQHIVSKLASVRHNQGRLIGKMQALGFGLRAEAVLQTLTEDVLKSSEIEGENLDRAQVRFSIARRLGMDIGALAAVDRDVETLTASSR